jgi:hypothetical protein
MIGGPSRVPAVIGEHEKLTPLRKDWRVRGVAVTAAAIGFLIGLVVFGSMPLRRIRRVWRRIRRGLVTGGSLGRQGAPGRTWR